MNKKILSKKVKQVKSLMTILKKRSGRDNSGQISVRHQGGRQKRYYREIDFKRDKRDVVGEVVRIEKDPNRNAFIALIKYPDEELRYIIQPQGLISGHKVISGENVDANLGNALPLKNVPIGTIIHNIEIVPGKGGQMIRSAGTTAIVIAKEEGFVQIKLQSGEVRKFFGDCYATIGQIGNINHKDEIVGSAGRNILRGIRPTVRGTAQNPRTHPHGGGEGRSGIGMPSPKSPWGKKTLGKKTRKRVKYSDRFIASRKK